MGGGWKLTGIQAVKNREASRQSSIHQGTETLCGVSLPFLDNLTYCWWLKETLNPEIARGSMRSGEAVLESRLICYSPSCSLTMSICRSTIVPAFARTAGSSSSMASNTGVRGG